jgi:hypothetical protein
MRRYLRVGGDMKNDGGLLKKLYSGYGIIVLIVISRLS